MYFPAEIEIEIASYLIKEDLINFRLTCKSFAKAGISLIPRNGISVMNTTRDTDALHELLKCTSIAKNTKSLRIFHAEWPVCSRHEWETHHLLFGGNSRFVHKYKRLLANDQENAFAEYEQFIKQQIGRRPSNDVDNITDLLRSLPNLESIEISSMNKCFWKLADNERFRRLQKSIWLYPRQSHDISSTLESTLIAIGTSSSRIQRLQIRGWVNPEKLSLAGNMPGFSSTTKLLVEGFQMYENEQSVHHFLRLFPNLIDVSLFFDGHRPALTSLDSMDWPQVKSMKLHGMWTSEEQFFDIFSRFSKSLLLFGLNRPALTDGSWKGLFTKIKNVGAGAMVTAGGELYGRSFHETIDINEEKARLLERFVQDTDFEWPF